MLTIPRKKGESIVIGEDIILTVLEIRGDKLRIQIDCPEHTSVHRKEVFDVIASQGEQRTSEVGPSYFVSN